MSGTSYVNYLMAGVFVQSVVFGSATTGVGVANDLQRGLIDCFRSLPMAQSAVLTDRVLADLIRGLFIILVTWASGGRPAGWLDLDLAFCLRQQRLRACQYSTRLVTRFRPTPASFADDGCGARVAA